MPKNIPKVEKIPYGKTESTIWLDRTREFHSWKKTDDYKKWRKVTWMKQHGLCYYCDISLLVVRQNIEHIVPRSRGGSNRWNNLVLSCSSCNKNKGASMLSLAKRQKLKNKQKMIKQSKVAARREEERLAYELRQRFQ